MIRSVPYTEMPAMRALYVLAAALLLAALAGGCGGCASVSASDFEVFKADLAAGAAVALDALAKEEDLARQASAPASRRRCSEPRGDRSERRWSRRCRPAPSRGIAARRGGNASRCDPPSYADRARGVHRATYRGGARGGTAMQCLIVPACGAEDLAELDDDAEAEHRRAEDSRIADVLGELAERAHR